MEEQDDSTIHDEEINSKDDVNSMKSPQHGSSIKGSDLTLSQMKFNKSNKTDIKSNRKFKKLLLNDLNSNDLHGDH